MRLLHVSLVLAVLVSAACHPGPQISNDPKLPVGGTIAGIVTSEASTALVGRKVFAVNTATGARFEATTGANGGYSVQVPEGTYRLEVDLRDGETYSKQPGETRINRSDLDPSRNFVIAGSRGAR